MADMPTPLKLTPDLVTLVNGASDSGNILLVAAVDAQHRPLLSYRGSVAVFSDTQLSFWARNHHGGTVGAIHSNLNVALIYRSPTVPLLQFTGRARVTTDETERRRAFDLAHERERRQDPEQKGAAIIVDLDEISGFLRFDPNAPQRIKMVR